MKMKKTLALTTALLMSLALAGCGEQPSSSSDMPSSSSESSSEPASQTEPIDAKAVLAVETFLNEKLPKAYTESPEYQCEIQALSSGAYQVTLRLDVNADGSKFTDESLDDVPDVAELESVYLIKDCLGEDQPYPLDFELVYVLNGNEVAKVVKAHDSETYTRTIDGKTDTF